MNPLKTIVTKIRSSPTLLAIIAILLFTALGFIGGRFLTPASVTTVTVQDTESKKQLAEALKVTDSLKEQLAVTQKQLQDVKVKTITVTKWVKAPNGGETRETTRTTERETHTDTTTDTVKDTTKDTVVADNRTETDVVHVHTESTVTKIFNSGPRWQVSAFGTMELFAPKNPINFNQVTPLLIYGGSAGYRFWGPFWVDLSGGGTRDLRTQEQGWFVGATLRGTLTF